MKLQQPPANEDGKVLMPTAIALYDEEVSRPLIGAHDDAPFAQRERGDFCVDRQAILHIETVRESER